MFKEGEKVRISSDGMKAGYPSEMYDCRYLTVRKDEGNGVLFVIYKSATFGGSQRVYSHHLEYAPDQIEEFKRDLERMLHTI